MRLLLEISFVLVTLAVFLPKIGLLAQWGRTRELSERMRREDALKHIYKSQINARRPTMESVAGALNIHSNQATALLVEMEKRGLLTFASGEIELSAAGRELALHIIRAHRLWEQFLSEHTGTPESDWHKEADLREHNLSREEVDALSVRLGNPTKDPHGDPIPSKAGSLQRDDGLSLNSIEVGTTAAVIHVEDEPSAIYAQLLAEGIRPGVKLRVLEKTPRIIRFWADGDEHVLAPVLANNIQVIAVGAHELGVETDFLSNLHKDERARVLGISPACRGAERRRLYDLGFVPGSEVTPELVGATGSPIAYRIRGALVALRREQAELIQIQPLEPVPP